MSEPNAPRPSAAPASPEAELAKLRQRLADLEQAYREASEELAEVSDRADLMILQHATVRQISAAIGREPLLQALQEVVINIIGSEELAIFDLVDGALRLARGFGVNPGPLRTIPLGQGPLGRLAAAGQTWVTGRDAAQLETEGLTAFVPLRGDGQLVGAIAIWRMLGHKPELVPSDLETLELLSVHGGQSLLLRQLLERSA